MIIRRDEGADERWGLALAVGSWGFLASLEGWVPTVDYKHGVCSACRSDVLEMMDVKVLDKCPVSPRFENKGIFRGANMPNTGAVATAGNFLLLPFTNSTSTFSPLAA